MIVCYAKHLTDGKILRTNGCIKVARYQKLFDFLLDAGLDGIYGIVEEDASNLLLTFGTDNRIL